MLAAVQGSVTFSKAKIPYLQCGAVMSECASEGTPCCIRTVKKQGLTLPSQH